MKQRTFLSKGLFEKDFMQTRVTTRNMTGIEKFMGYLLGPGLIIILTCMITYLREIFYVDVWKMDLVFGAQTYMIMNTVATVSSTIGGLIVGYLTTHTVSRAGRIRPYVLIGTLLGTISGVAMFWNPFTIENGSAFMAWVYFSNILYYGVAFSLYNVRIYMLALSTRNVNDRNQVTTIRTATEAMIPGMFVSLLVMGVLYFMFLQISQPDGSVIIGDESVWRMFIAIPALIAIPGAFIEYFWTKERITEDDRLIHAASEQPANSIPVHAQIKALLGNKYFILALILTIAATLLWYLQGNNCRQYFMQYVLGANAENNYSMLYLVVAMQPQAVGAVLLPVLMKRISVRRIAIVSCILNLAGIGICMIAPTDFAMACAGGIIFSCGQVAISFMSGVFIQQACDDVEYKSGFRPEGLLGMIIITTVYSLILSPLSATFETVLVNYTPYQLPAEQLSFYLCEVKDWILFCYYGGQAIYAVVILAVMIFFNIDKHYPEIQAELKRRRIAACEARGEIWVDDEERERLEREESERQAEIDRIADLKVLCVRKGLDFDIENQKYLDKKAARDAKLTAKQIKKNKSK